MYIKNKSMEYLSLYEYLGKPAGMALGGEVRAAALSQEIETQQREISNPKYTGPVTLYPKDFLDFHFRTPESENKSDIDDLPF